jgi:hypothetical protein
MNNQRIKSAVEFLGAFSWSGRVAYYADETRSFYWVTRPQLETLGRMLSERSSAVAYSEWCAAGAGSEVGSVTSADMRAHRGL